MGMEVFSSKNIGVELVKKAKEALADDKISAAELQELKKIAAENGSISVAERAFIANLDNKTVIDKLKSADFNPATAEFVLDREDKTLTLDNKAEFRIWGGERVFNPQGNADLTSVLDNLKQDERGPGKDARCSCNSTVAALVAKGKGAFKEALDKLEKNLVTNYASKDNIELIYKLEQLRNSLASNSLTQEDLTDLAILLYEKFDKDKSDKKMNYDDIIRMQKAVGLIPDNVEKEIEIKGNIVGIGSRPNNINAESKEFKNAQKNVADSIWARLSPGKTATVGVHLDNLRTGIPDHAITVGITKKGEKFVYDSLGVPDTMLTGKKAEEYLQKKIGVCEENNRMSDIRTYASFIPHR